MNIEPERIERAIEALGVGIGDPLPGELEPDPAKYLAAETAKIVRDHTRNVALLDDWARYLEKTAVKNDRETVLLDLVNRRIQQCCQIISSLQSGQGVN